jgi:hypothetical protein
MWFDLPPPDPAIEIFAATTGMSKGLSQTDGPQAVPKAYLRFGAVQAGAQWKNLSSSTADGEAALFVNASGKLGSFQLSGGIAFKFNTGVDGPTDSKAWELTGAVTHKFGPVTARVNAIYSPDDLGTTRQSLFVEGGPVFDLGRGWTASAAIGRRSRERGDDYAAFNAGIGKLIRGIQLDLRYYDTDRSGLGDPYRARLVASARLRI